MRDTPVEDRSLDALRVKVLSTALTLTAIAAPLLSVWMLVLLRRELSFTLIAMCSYTLCFPALKLAQPRLRLPVAANLYLALMLGLALMLQLRGGISATVASVQLIVIVLSALLFGARGVAVGLLASLACVAIAGFAVVGAHVPPIVPDLWDPHLSSVWIRSGIILAAFGGAAALAILYMVTELERETALLQQALEREREQRLALERANAEKERTRQALAEAERVEALGRLASGVAHDFNNLLTVIVGACEVAQLTPDLAEAKTCLEDIARASNQAAELTRSLLLLGRRDVSLPSSIDLQQHIERMFGTIRRLLPSDIELSVTLAERCWIQADPTQLDRVLLNLIVNARDAIEGPGRIQVQCRTAVRTPGTRSESGRRFVALSVSDTGRGMTEEVRRRIFEPFFTTKPIGEGTGMGMAMVSSFVEASGGSVDVDSAPGRGTTVTLYLPETSGAVREEAAPRRLARGAAEVARTRAILVVEDNAAVRASTVRILERAGFEVLSAADGDRALELVDDEKVAFDLLCIDGVILGARSAEVIRHTRERRPGTVIVVCSGYVDEELVRRGIQAGEYACVRKPYTTAELLACIRRELGLSGGA